MADRIRMDGENDDVILRIVLKMRQLTPENRAHFLRLAGMDADDKPTIAEKVVRYGSGVAAAFVGLQEPIQQYLEGCQIIL